MNTVRTRFAPSPTGSLHVGGVRTALYCLLWARRNKGAFLLRIEDTDRKRSSEQAAKGLVSDLSWLGMEWDEGPGVGGPVGPYAQSERLPIYNEVLDRLLASGHAYEAWESSAELNAKRAVCEAKKETFRYRRNDPSPEQVAAYRAEGRLPVVRLTAPDHAVTVNDAVVGDVTLTADQLDDIVIRKADGYPTYHFAVVVDDHHMGVTHVLRGQEHLMNTHKHLGLYAALGWEPPSHGHLSIIFNPAGQKMSKREKARAARLAAREQAKAQDHPKGDWQWLADLCGCELEDLKRFMKKKHDRIDMATAIAVALDVELPMIEVIDFRKAGFLPEALLNYLALLGWSPGDDREQLSFDELVEAFTLDRLVKTPARFDVTKLKWMSGALMKTLENDVLLRHMDAWLEVNDSPLAAATAQQKSTLIELYRPRASTFGEMEASARFFFERPTVYGPPKALRKHIKGNALQLLAASRDALSTAEWTLEGIEAAMSGVLAAAEVGLGKVAQPIRIAVSGGPATPSLYDTLHFFERDEVCHRIEAAIQHFGAEA
jgi:glutamyl/glutaminyl-tRNA synthetase